MTSSMEEGFDVASPSRPPVSELSSSPFIYLSIIMSTREDGDVVGGGVPEAVRSALEVGHGELVGFGLDDGSIV